jgi:hypothetical protein
MFLKDCFNSAITVTAIIVSNTSWAEDMDKNFNYVAPIAFLYERDTARSHMISRRLRRFYLKGQPLTNASLTGLGEVSYATEH